MQYNSHSDNQDIVSSIGDAVGVDTTVEIKQITRAVNRSGNLIWSWIFESYGGWYYDDNNNDDLPFARTDLLLGQNKYNLPSSTLSLYSVEVKDSSGNWTKLHKKPLEATEQFTSEEEYSTTEGQPMYYSLVSDVLKIYPIPDEEVENGLRVRIDRGSVSFASTDTTQSPGFASEFHSAIVDGASYLIARNKKLVNMNELRADWLNWEPIIKKYYAERFKELYPKELNNGDYTCSIL